MTLSFQALGFQFTVAIFRLGPGPMFRRYRLHPREAVLRRRLLDDVRQRLLEGAGHG